ncbi:MAG: type II toxin-antitoxin system VapC family toxin [ANME-2 cluster archaeon]|nr:type II toxin-antitoxin system VapC family toxin [ANME-2 cluster archaeon]MBC2700972.1 type II toxin-antitoxin system VapC family toxin [ANME-2 cluster archaeon]MBC2709110.1 type II toxin-antitoxin system VapC family toxin [ANME-2 cluster archaeon]MBC2747450.1 type II toxin-antitoxin system VapC family toxin [ANME-2 cluster archaeon]MBC2764269.1 type II toxin-antitoxin system VapC family toxin [ANME-2 cluster archaeon]
MNTSRFFMDTAYVLALLNQNDKYHEKAKAILPKTSIADEVCITETVIIEIGNSLARSNRSMAIAFIESLYTTYNVSVIPVDSELLGQAIDFYHRREDKEWGLTDCISFIVMEDQNLTNALTSDEHFIQAGFRALLREDIPSKE